MVYEVYLRSFADADGDGVGDLAGLLERLPHLAGLGVDALWITPFYPSPMIDGGYDITDHCDVEPVFGTLADADAVIARAHGLGLRVVVDVVPNHTSDQHPWFLAALASPAGSAERALYYFRDGRGDGPPNDWISAFGGPAWAREAGPAGQWYLHTFAPEQPDVDWGSAVVRERYDAVLRFWLDRGVDGLRLDAVPAIGKTVLADGSLPDAGHAPGAPFASSTWGESPQWDGPSVHEVARGWRRTADSYPGERLLVSESVVTGPERLSRYVRPGEMHTTFGFDLLRAPWRARALRAAVDSSLAALASTGAPATWVLSSHDETRHGTRYGGSDTEVVRRRARAAALLLLALPGCACLYQGEELGLPEVVDLPVESLRDPTWERSGRTVRGRDGCRVPLPWTGTTAPYGFSPDGVVPWLPQPEAWAGLSVAAQQDDPASVLALYRRALALRRDWRDRAGEALGWLDLGPDVLALDRGGVLRCVVNLGATAVPLAGLGTVVLHTGAVEDGTDVLGPDEAAWLTPD